MKITSVSLYQTRVRMTEPRIISGGRIVEAQDVSVVSIQAEDGTVGWGECSPWGPLYMSEFSGGIQAAMRLIAPNLIGVAANSPNAVRARADETVMGQQLAKSAFDTAVLDLTGKLLGVSAATLLGGEVNSDPRHAAFLATHREEAVVAEEIERGRAQGRPCFEFKAKGDRARDIETIKFVTSKMQVGELLKIDVNGSWSPIDAATIMSVAPEHHILFEQPCATLDQLRHLRQLTHRPIAIDESATSLEEILVAYREGVCNALNLKIDRAGGPTLARSVATTATSLGVPLMVQSVAGSVLSTAGIISVAKTVNPKDLIYIWHPSRMAVEHTATGIENLPDGRVRHDANCPGLGVEIDHDVLGDPVAEFT